jgi:hypothetical protein
MIKVVSVNSISPATSKLPGDGMACKGQPRSIKPDATLVWARYPNQYGRSIHYLAELRFKLAERLS